MTSVLFTGAGASRAIGYPLTNELLPRMLAEIRSKVLFADINDEAIDQGDRDALEEYLNALLPGLRKVNPKQLPLITDVFSLVEHAIVTGESLPIGGEADLRRFRYLLKEAITDVILGDFLRDYEDEDPGERRQRRVLEKLADWFEDRAASSALVSTNYDIGLEYELYERIGRGRVKGKIDLGFDWRDVDTGRERTRPGKPSIRVYKLHGSLDVLRCPLCGYVYFNPWGVIAAQPFIREATDQNTCHCDARLELHIVSPSLVRDIREVNLLSVWRSAFEWLRNAEEWIIVGYSLPPEDIAIRSLLIRAYATAEKSPRVTVVQRGDGTRGRYEVLFPDCDFVTGGLEAFLGVR